MVWTKLDSLTTDGSTTLPIIVVAPNTADERIAALSNTAKRWLSATGFKPKAGKHCIFPDTDGNVAGAILVTSKSPELWDIAAVRSSLPSGPWVLDDPDKLIEPSDAILAWALGAYKFERYKKANDRPEQPVLAVTNGSDLNRARALAESAYLGRDLVNTPALDLGPAELAAAIEEMADEFGAHTHQIVGDALIEENFPAIHVVGMGSAREPRLVELRWGPEDGPKITLVGKGVCFDTGGLDLKPSRAMAMMKKDMGGAAAMIALARSTMAANLPVRLRLLVPAVENSVSGTSFRPGDIIKTRAGKSVEIGNTDAEGRLVLADALKLASEEDPDLVIDAATLTGAARVALGPDLPVLFSNDDNLAHELLSIGTEVHDPLWALPLHDPYKRYLKSPIADINNAGNKPFAGAVTAALFLKEFIGETKHWAHLDLYGFNDETRPGRPAGGEAIALRPLFTLLERRYRQR